MKKNEELMAALKKAVYEGKNTVTLHLTGRYGKDIRVEADPYGVLECMKEDGSFGALKKCEVCHDAPNENGCLSKLLGLPEGCGPTADEIGLVTCDGEVLYCEDDFEVRMRFDAREVRDVTFDMCVPARQYRKVLEGVPPEKAVSGLVDKTEAELDDPCDRYIVLRQRGEDLGEPANVGGYLLVSVCDREIVTEQFPTFEMARGQMMKEMHEADPDTDYAGMEAEEWEDADYTAGFHEYGGYVNAMAENDWLIVPLE